MPNKWAMIKRKEKETRILILKNTDTGRAFWLSNSTRKQTERKIKGRINIIIFRSIYIYIYIYIYISDFFFYFSVYVKSIIFPERLPELIQANKCYKNKSIYAL